MSSETKPAAKKPAAKKPAAKVAPAKPAPVVEEAANLSAVAEDINKVLKPEPPLDPKAKTLAEDIKELLPMVKKGDALSAPTWAALKVMGWSGDKKAVAKAAGKKAPGERKAGVGDVVRNVLKTKAGWGRDNADILAEVKKAIPGCGTTVSCISWYRMDMKKKGIAPVG